MQNIDATIANFCFSEDEISKLVKLKKLIQAYPEIRFQTDNIFLSKYLECVDWNVTLALKRMIHIYKFKSEYPNWTFKDGPLGYQKLIDMHYTYPLMKRDINGRLVVIYKLSNIRSNVTLHQLIHFDSICFECLMMEQSVQRNGITFIIDCKNYPIHVLKWLSLKAARINGIRIQLIPLKQFDCHIVNTSAITNAILKPFISGPIMERLHFHTRNWSALHAYTGKDCLPKEYGGNASDSVADFNEFYKILSERHEYVKQSIDYGYIK